MMVLCRVKKPLCGRAYDGSRYKRKRGILIGS
nr:MAG TPA: hypothetical protein [Caudoviricetes sp.]